MINEDAFRLPILGLSFLSKMRSHFDGACPRNFPVWKILGHCCNRSGELSAWYPMCSDFHIATATSKISATDLIRGRSWLRWKAPLLLVLLAILFGKVLIDMACDWWSDPALSQGLLVPPLACYIAWHSRARTLNISPTDDFRGLFLTVLGCVLFIVGKLAAEFFLTRFSFVVVIAGLIWTFWGPRRLRTLAMPLLLLATMVPLPALVYNSAATPLQLFSSKLATTLVQAIGVSVFRDGNVIQLAGMSLGVAESCSGLNSISALLVGSILIGSVCCSRLGTRAVVCVASVPIAIGVNVMRVAGTAILADQHQAFALGYYHLFSGWLVFVIGLVCLYSTACLLHWRFDVQGSQNA